MFAFLKKHKLKIILLLVAIVVLTVAFLLPERPHSAEFNEVSLAASAESSALVSDKDDKESAVSVSESKTESKSQSESASQPSKASQVSEPSTQKSQSSASSKADSTVSKHEENTQPSQQEISTAESHISEVTSVPSTVSAPKEHAQVSKTESSRATSTPQSKTPTQTSSEVQSQFQQTASIRISCQTVLNHTDLKKPTVHITVPKDGMILSTQTVPIIEGETVFDFTKRLCRDNRIPFEFSGGYVEGIGNLYEFDYGQQSGWMYSVNGQFLNYGCKEVKLKANDTVEWLYTCDLGNDVGNPYR